MPFFRRPDYHSEASLFIDHLKAKKPQLESQQRAGRALLWDKNLDRSEQQEFKSAKVAQGAYVYQTKPGQ
jgi:hypothetical protein